MKFTFTGRKLDVTEELRKYSEKKLSKLDKFFQSDSETSVVFHSERGRYTAEVTVRCANMYFRAQETAQDAYSAIDSIVDMIERQIRKNKTRLEKRLRAGAFDKEPSGQVQPDLTEEIDFEIVRKKRFALKPMVVEEAILQMNLLGHEFYAFKNAEDDNCYCVVYKRNGGGYGLIESD